METGRKKKSPSQTDKLLELLNKTNLYFFHDQYSRPYVAIDVDNHREVHPVKSTAFKRWTAGQFYKKYGTGISPQSMNTALLALEARAVHEGKQIELHNRIARHEGQLYYDLSDPQWRAVCIDEHGWAIIDRPPILFRRFNHQSAQKKPSVNGNLRLIEKYLRLAEKEKQLLIIWICSTFFPEIPHPIPNAYGDKGSTKSTSFAILRKIIDPSIMLSFKMPDDKQEFARICDQHYLLPIDNLSTVPDWLSDEMCRVIYGSGLDKRELFTDDDAVIRFYRRCIALNGINVPARKPDLMDRSILLKFVRVPKRERKSEYILWAEFERDMPSILGGIFDIISKAMRERPNVHLVELPRMADFSVWGEAISRAMGYPAMSFVDAYNENIEAQNKEAIAGHILGSIILKIVDDGGFDGTPLALYHRVLIEAETFKIDSRAKDFPKSANSFTRKLNDIADNLREEGIVVVTGDAKAIGGGGKRKVERRIRIAKISPTPSTSSIAPISCENVGLEQNTISHQYRQQQAIVNGVGDLEMVEIANTSNSESPENSVLKASGAVENDVDDVYGISPRPHAVLIKEILLGVWEESKQHGFDVQTCAMQAKKLGVPVNVFDSFWDRMKSAGDAFESPAGIGHLMDVSTPDFLKSTEVKQ